MSGDTGGVWKALSDNTRREILDALRGGAKTTTELVELFPSLSRFAVMKHLDVLRGVDLVVTRQEGRRRINSLNAVPLREVVERWVGKYEAFWANTLLRVKESAEDSTSGDKPGNETRQ